MSDPVAHPDSVSALVERYQSIIPDADEFSRFCLTQALCRDFWFNPLKTSVTKALSLLQAEGIDARSLAGIDGGFRTQRDAPLGKSWLYLAGLLHIQEAVSQLPVKFLQAQPGEVVLDMCAAPGNKTAQLAVAMNNQGTLIANDMSYQRHSALVQAARRLGLVNISIHTGDGAQFPLAQPSFDKILVDAPCSCEGGLRRSNRKRIQVSQANSERMAITQIALLKKALALAKPGARIVYSTCTFAPEENEAVIDTILKYANGDLSVLEVDLPGWTTYPGILSWQGRHYAKALEKTVRIWPHSNDSGGFFMAVLEKRGQRTTPRRECVTERPLPEPIAQQQQRYGFSNSDLQRYHYFKASSKGYYMINADNQMCSDSPLSTLAYDASGLFCLKTKIPYPKLSTASAMLLGSKATTNRLDISRSQLHQYLQTQALELTSSQQHAFNRSGFVTVCFDSVCVGMGLLLADSTAKPGLLLSQFPKYLAAHYAS